MDCCYRPAECSPSSLIGGERYDLLAVGNQMCPQYRTHTCGITCPLEVDCSIHSIGIGAGKRGEPSLCRCLGECLRARSAESKGEVSVGMEVGEHGPRSCELWAVSYES